MPNYTSVEKTAIILLALGKELAAEILSKLDPRDVKKIAHAMTHLERVNQESVNSVLLEFGQDLDRVNSSTFVGQPALTKAIMDKAFGAEKSDRLLQGLGLEWESVRQLVATIDSQVLSDFCEKEKDQVVALILAFARLTQRIEIFRGLSQERRSSVMLAVASLGHVSADVLAELEEVLQELSDKSRLIHRMKVGGPKMAAEILNQMPGDMVDGLLKEISVVDSELGERIKAEMFRFDDLVRIEGRHLQRLLAATDRQLLAVALKKCGEDTINHIMANLSKGAQDDVKDLLTSLGPKKVSEVEEAQAKVTEKALEMQKAGEIEIRRPGEEYV